MNESKKTIEIRVERTIPAPHVEVFDGWLNPKITGTPWNAADKLLFNPEVDGFFYWLIRRNSGLRAIHEVERPGRIQHTWMSRSTSGEESMVTMTFHKKEENTLMTLVHSGLPDTDGGRGHEKGWNYLVDLFAKKFTDASRKKD